MALTGTFTDIPSGTLQAALDGVWLRAPFDMKASFTSSTNSCADGEYRQFVKGVFKIDGVAIEHVLCGQVLLSPDQLQEDGCPPPGCSAYGYRSCPEHPYNQFLPTRATGCTYEGYDAPGLTADPGQTVEMDLTFEAFLLNTATGEHLASANWKVVGLAVIPSVQTEKEEEMPAKSPEPRILRTPDGDGWRVSLLYVASGSAPLQLPEASQIELLDARGASLAFELLGRAAVGGTNTSSQHLRLRLSGAERPVRALITDAVMRREHEIEDSTL